MNNLKKPLDSFSTGSVARKPPQRKTSPFPHTEQTLYSEDTLLERGGYMGKLTNSFENASY